MLSNKIAKIGESTKSAIEKVDIEPSKENVELAIMNIEKDDIISENDRQYLLNELRGKFVNLFNFDNCPVNDYELLKVEAKFLCGISHFSFLLMAQRLLIIRDKQLYINDGYTDFKSFIIKEMKIAKGTAYNYIDLITLFGVQTFGLDDKINPSKLIPVIPLLKSNDSKIPKEFIKDKFINESKDKSAREIQAEAKLLKIKYGLLQEDEDKTVYERLFFKYYEKIPKKISDNDKQVLKDHIEKIKWVIENNF